MEKKSFSLADSLFAWVCIIFGFFFFKIMDIDKPLVFFIYLMCLYAAAVIMVRVKGFTPSAWDRLLLGSGAVIALSVVLSGGFVPFCSFVYALVAGVYYVYSATGNALEPKLSGVIISENARALFVLPFSSFGKLFPALVPPKDKKLGMTVLFVLIGLVIAIIPTWIVCDLLSYDSAFRSSIEGIFNFNGFDLADTILELIFGVPLAMYIFGLYHSSVEKTCADKLTKEAVRQRAENRRGVPAAMAAAAMIPVLAIYGIFFFAQRQYFMAGLSGVLPEGLSYADYARSGFFDLCKVAVINLIILSLVGVFAKKGTRGESAAVRVLSIMLSVASLFLILTAAAKMILYVRAYGLTPKRVYSSWFMCVLAAVFVLVTVKQLVPRFRLMPVCVCVCFALYAVLAFSSAEKLIARYNADRYLDGSLTGVDCSAMLELGDAAVPEMVRLAEEFGIEPVKYVGNIVKAYDVAAGDEAEYVITACLRLMADDHMHDADFLSWSRYRAQAHRALEAAGWLI